MTDFSKKVYPVPNLDSRNRFHLPGENIRNASPAPSRQLNPGGTRNNPNFGDRVYAAVKKIPRGRVATYKTIAAMIDCPGGSRAVGNALNKNRLGNVPCHRVIRSDASIGGFVWGSRKKIKLLRQEGLRVIGRKVDKKFIM